MATLQMVIYNRLLTITPLTAPPAGGLGFALRPYWPSYDRDADKPLYNTNGSLKRLVVVRPANENQHPSLPVQGLRKWFSSPQLYVYTELHENGKDAADQAKLLIENALCDPTWHPVITGGQLPTLELDAQLDPLDNVEQFPNNYVVVLRFTAVGARSLPAI